MTSNRTLTDAERRALGRHLVKSWLRPGARLDKWLAYVDSEADRAGERGAQTRALERILDAVPDPAP
jgi:hypothetical protein